MATKVDGSGIWNANTAFEQALKAINQADGFNTSPKVQIGGKTIQEVPEGEFPTICIIFGDIAPATEQIGGAEQGVIRWGQATFVLGYFRSSGHRKELYRAGNAMLLDVLSALYAEETLPDSNGIGRVEFINPGTIQFDVESFASENQGYFLAEFEVVFSLIRGANP